MLVALKCDLRETAADGEEVEGPEKNVNFIQYPEGLAVAERIKVCLLSRDQQIAGNYIRVKY